MRTRARDVNANVRMKPLRDCLLYAFVDTGYLRGREPDELARQLCEGGADLIQLRAKGLPTPELLRLAKAVQSAIAGTNVWLVINDHVDVARAVGAPLVHLGQEDFFDAGYRHVSELCQTMGAPGGASIGGSAGGKPTVAGAAVPQAGQPLQVGLSTHAPGQARRAIDAGAAYVAVGPVFATQTKPGVAPVTLEYVRWAAANLGDIPWFAIGGLDLANLDSVLAAGARRICVVSAILGAADVAKACQQFKERLLSASA